jgi:hypothetical protein
VVLLARPGGSVALAVESSDPGEATVSPAVLRFTPGSWGTPQIVTVRGVDDAEDDGDQVVNVTVWVDDGQSHDAFEELGDRTIGVVNVDDDEALPAGLMVTESEGRTRVSEAGTYDSVRVALASPPTSNVVVSASSGNILEVTITAGALLTFTPSSWSVPQVVVLRGVNDFSRDGDREVPVTLAVVSSFSADAYHGLSQRITVRNRDDDRKEKKGKGDDDDADDDEDDDDNSGPGGGRGPGPGK